MRLGFRNVSFYVNPQLYEALRPFGDENRGMRHGAAYFIATMLRVAELMPEFPLSPETPDLYRRVTGPIMKAPLTEREYAVLEDLSCQHCRCNRSEMVRRLLWLGIEFHRKIYGPDDLRLRYEEEFFRGVMDRIRTQLLPVQ